MSSVSNVFLHRHLNAYVQGYTELGAGGEYKALKVGVVVPARSSTFTPARVHVNTCESTPHL